MKSSRFVLSSTGLMRRPILDWRSVYFVGCSGAREDDSDDLRRLFDREDVSLVLSSVSARASQIAKANDAKSLTIKYRYLSRLSTRCVPLGWAAVTQVVNFIHQTEVSESNQLNENLEPSFSARLDRAIVVGAVRRAREMTQMCLSTSISCNPTIYRTPFGFRYYELTAATADEAYEISELESSQAIELVLSTIPACGSLPAGDLASCVASSTGSTLDEAMEFLSELARSSFLIVDLLAQPIHQYLHNNVPQESGGGLAVEPIVELKDAANLILTATSQGRPFDAKALNSEVIACIGTDNTGWGIDLSVQDRASRRVSRKYLDEIARSLDDLFPHFQRVDRPLDRFFTQFSRKFGESSVPLVGAADPYLGIDLKETVVDEAPTMRPDNLLLQLWERSTSRNEREIQLDPSDISRLSAAESSPLPKSGVIQVELFESGSSMPGIHLQGFRSGPKHRFFSRFLRAHNLAVKEPEHQEDDPDEIVADVLFAGPNRLSNLTLSPPSTLYVIVCDDIAPPAECIPIAISELELSVVDGNPRIYCPRLGKYVHPRMNHPVNAFVSTRPAVSLLGYLDRQGSIDFEFTWPTLLFAAKFLPRISYRGVILSLARWRMSGPSLKAVQNADNVDAIKSVLTNLGVPRFFTHGTQDLIITYDQSSQTSLLALQSALRGLSSCSIFESLLNERLAHPSISSLPVNQIHIPFSTEGREPTSVIRRRELPENEAAVYYPGDEWATIKIYANERALDKLISTVLDPVVRAFPSGSQWFFLRYRDQAAHIRLRVKAEAGALWQSVVPTVLENLRLDTARGFVHDLIVEPYVREISRYGYQHIDLHERLFHVDSMNAFDIICGKQPSRVEATRSEICLLQIDALLDALGLSYSFRRDRIRESYRHLIHRPTASRNFLSWKGFLLQNIGSEWSGARSNLQLSMADRYKSLLASSPAPVVNIGALIHMTVNRTIGMLRPFEEASMVEALARTYDGIVRRTS